MAKSAVLEICVQTVEHAVAAERGGADRIELCSDLLSGGLTPSIELMQEARRHVNIPFHAMIRPRPGDFCYSDNELAIMRHDISAAAQLGMDGLVFGILQDNQQIDLQRMRAMVALAVPLPVTFHRAFDVAPNVTRALQDVIASGSSRILTSGGRERAVGNLSSLAGLVRAAQEHVAIMVCGNLNPENIGAVVLQTSAQEVHSSVGTSYSNSSADDEAWRDGGNGSNLSPQLFARRVATLVEKLRCLGGEKSF